MSTPPPPAPPAAPAPPPPTTPPSPTSSLTGNLWRYQVFQIFWMTAFFTPVLVLFWQENGLDAFDVYLLQGLFAVAVVVLEVPTGMVADRFGKRQSLLCGVAFVCLGMGIYALGQGFFSFLAAEIVLAFGLTFISGADTALLYDTLQALGRRDDFQRFEGRARALQMVSFAATNVVGAFVGAWSTRATVWLSMLGAIVALFIALGFVEPGRGDAARRTSGTYRQLIGESLRFVARHRLVRWYVLFFAVLSGSSTWLLWLYQPYMQHTGLPVWSFGLFFAVFNLVAAWASSQSHRFDARLGRYGALVGLMVLQLLPLPLLALVVAPASTLFVLFHQTVRGIARPLISARLLDYTFADKRATVLSLASLAGRLFFALTAPLVGLWAREETMSHSLLYQAALLALCLLVLVFLLRRVPAKYWHVKDSVAARR